jgi:adenylate cyclase
MLFGKAVEADPAFVRAWIGLAEVCSLHALFLDDADVMSEKAFHAAQKALELAPGRADSFMARGHAHLASENFTDAEADFLKAIELDPRLVRAYYFLGRAAQHQGQHEKSLIYFGKATELDPDDYESPLLVLGNYEKLGDFQNRDRYAYIGLERAEHHIQDYPDNPRPYCLGASGLIAIGELERALKWADKAAELSPDDSSTNYNLACIFALAGDHEKALDLLEHSISNVSWIENDPELDSIRDHPRYLAYIEKLRKQ